MGWEEVYREAGFSYLVGWFFSSGCWEGGRGFGSVVDDGDGLGTCVAVPWDHYSDGTLVKSISKSLRMRIVVSIEC